MKAQKVKEYALPHYLLRSQEDRVKTSYFLMLGVFLLANDNVNEEQKQHLWGLLSGAEHNKTIQELMSDAENVEIEDYEKFVQTFTDNQLKYRWCFDCMTLSWLGEWSDEQMSFLADLMEELGLCIEDVAYIKKQSRVLLEGNIKRYLEAELLRPESIPENWLQTYVEYSLGGFVLNNAGKLTIRMNQKTAANDNWDSLWYGKDEVELENLLFTGNHMPQFKTNKTVSLKNCEFDGGAFTITFLGKSITVDQCEFKNFTSCVLDFTEPEKVQITNSIFDHCTCIDINCSSPCTMIRRNGSTLYALKSCVIDSCTFDSCEVKIAKPFGDVLGIISNGSWSVKNSKFISCNSYYKYGGASGDYRKSKESTLFTKCEFEKNEVYESAALA